MSDLTVKLQSIDDKVMFNATARETSGIIIDYFHPLGTGRGYTSLELLMMSFGSCISTTLLTVLRHRMKKIIKSISAELEGIVREEHPKALSHILLCLNITAGDFTETEVWETLKVLKDKLCPVWSMIKGNVTISVKVAISE